MNPRQQQKQLDKLGGWRQFAFLLALAERAFPNFAFFSDLTDRTAGDRFRDGLNLGWSMLLRKDHNVDVLQLLTRLERGCPDPEAHDVYGVQPALDAWWLLEQALLCHVNPDKKRAAEGASVAMNTVTTFIEVTEGEGLADEELVKLFDDHDLTRAEKGFQEALLEMLRKARAPDPSVIHEILRMAHNEGVSNLGLEVPERWAGYPDLTVEDVQ